MPTLELWYETSTESVLVNDPDDEFLHDIFAAPAPPFSEGTGT